MVVLILLMVTRELRIIRPMTCKMVVPDLVETEMMLGMGMEHLRLLLDKAALEVQGMVVTAVVVVMVRGHLMRHIQEAVEAFPEARRVMAALTM